MEINKGTQLKGYIQREIKKNKMHSNYGYTYYFCRNFLERLYASKPESFVLKGGFSQFANLEKIVRPITDIDITVINNIEKANNLILELAHSDHKMKFIIKQSFVTTNATINYRIICQFDNIQHLITVDLRKEKDLNIINKPLPTLFSNDTEFPIMSITLEEHLANKIYISILNLQLNIKLGKQFRRFKDFYDIYNILTLGNIDEDKLSDFLMAKIKNDEFLCEYNLQGNLFTKTFILENQEKWEENANRFEFNKDIAFKETVEETNEIISRIRK